MRRRVRLYLSIIRGVTTALHHLSPFQFPLAVSDPHIHQAPGPLGRFGILDAFCNFLQPVDLLSDLVHGVKEPAFTPAELSSVDCLGAVLAPEVVRCPDVPVVSVVLELHLPQVLELQELFGQVEEFQFEFAGQLCWIAGEADVWQLIKRETETLASLLRKEMENEQQLSFNAERDCDRGSRNDEIDTNVHVGYS